MAVEIPEINYAGIPLAEKFNWMQTGAGVGGIEPAVSTLGKLAPAFDASADHINAALRGTGVSWQGAAASAGYRVPGAHRPAGPAHRAGQQARRFPGG